MTCPSEELQSFYTHRNELTVESGVLLWGMRVVVPTRLRHTVLEQLHESHPGVTRCKQLVRSYVWWPCIDADIEHLVKSCEDCTATTRPERACTRPLGFRVTCVSSSAYRPHRLVPRTLLARVGRRLLEIRRCASRFQTGFNDYNLDSSQSLDISDCPIKSYLITAPRL